MANGHTDAVLRHFRRLVDLQGSHDPPDHELLGRYVRDGDEAAFEALLLRHGPMVLRVCQRVLAQRQDAEDAFQATFLVLARKAARIARRELLANWLYGVAYRTAMAARADAARRQTPQPEPPGRAPADPAAEAATRDLCSAVDEELNQLPSAYRVPLLLCYLEGLTRDQAARQLGWSVRTLHRRLERGRQLLRERLTRRGLTLSGALLAPAVAQVGGSGALPATLVGTTMTAALDFAAGPAAAGAVSTRMIALAARELKPVVAGKIKTIAALVLALGLVSGAVPLAWWAASESPPAVQQAEQPTAPPAAEVAPSARTDLFGDALPDGALFRLGTVRFRHDSWVNSIALSPDGKTLFGGSALSVRLWDAVTGKPLRRFAIQDLWELGAIALSPDGRTLAGGGSSTIYLWEVSSGKELRHWEVPVGKNVLLDRAFLFFSTDGKTLLSSSAGGDDVIRLWEVETGKLVREFSVKLGTLQACALSPDGKTVAVAADGGDRKQEGKVVRLWDVTTARQLLALPDGPPATTDLAFSPDGSTLATAHTDRDRPVRLWDAATGKELRSLQGAGKFFAVAFSPDGKNLAAAGAHNTIQLWDLTAREPAPSKTLGGLAEGRDLILYRIGFFPDGKTLAGVSAFNTVHFWDVASGKPVRRFDGHENEITAVAYSRGGKVLATGCESSGTIRLWDPVAGKEVGRLPALNGEVTSLAFTPDGRALVSGHGGGVVHLREVATGKGIRSYEHNKGHWVVAVALSPEGNTLASASADKTIRLWDVDSGKEVLQLQGNPEMRSLAFSPDGRTLAMGARLDHAGKAKEGCLRLWDVPSGKELPGFGTSVSSNAVAFSLDGRILASGGVDNIVRLWELASRQQRLALKHEWTVTSVAFSPDGRWLLAGGERSNKGESCTLLWDVLTGEVVSRFASHSGGVLSVAFAPDGQTCVSGSQDTTALIWDVAARLRERKPRRLDLTAAELDALWKGLSEADAARAYRAMGTLISCPDRAIRLVQDRLPPVAVTDPKRLAALLADLESEQFDVREKATQALEGLAASAEAELRRALRGNLSPEAKQRLKQVLDKLEGADAFQAQRAVEVLERIETEETRRVLAALARGLPEARLTREAKAVLARLEKRPDEK
jgi:RNA polymerase sigma factor (sigma-70 family)